MKTAWTVSDRFWGTNSIAWGSVAVQTAPDDREDLQPGHSSGCCDIFQGTTPQKNLDEKRCLKPLMDKLFADNKRPRFVNGRFYADGRTVSRDTAALTGQNDTPAVTCHARHVPPLPTPHAHCVPAFLVTRILLPRNRHAFCHLLHRKLYGSCQMMIYSLGCLQKSIDRTVPCVRKI